MPETQTASGLIVPDLPTVAAPDDGPLDDVIVAPWEYQAALHRQVAIVILKDPVQRSDKGFALYAGAMAIITDRETHQNRGKKDIQSIVARKLQGAAFMARKGRIEIVPV